MYDMAQFPDERTSAIPGMNRLKKHSPAILRGNLAPGGQWVKPAGKEGEYFKGIAEV